MKVAVTARGTNVEDAVDPRFGRCVCFLVVETDDMSVEVVENSNIEAGGGAGIQSAQLVADTGVSAVLTGNCGPNAFRALEAAGIAVVTGASGTVREAVANYMEGTLVATQGPTVPSHAGTTSPQEPVDTVRIGIPVIGGKLSAHFGHCESFALVDADRQRKIILATQTVPAPPHEPGLLPRWLKEQGAGVILAGGMGGRAKALFEEQGITVVVGAPSHTPVSVVNAYLHGSLETGENACDH